MPNLSPSFVVLVTPELKLEIMSVELFTLIPIRLAAKISIPINIIKKGMATMSDEM
jgi:hypothetical protein